MTGTAIMVLMLSVFLTAGVVAASGALPMVWTPAPKPVVETVLVVGGDIIVDVRNPSDKTLTGCRVYAGDQLLTGPSDILPGRVASYTGPATSRYVNAVCGQSRDVRLAHQVHQQASPTISTPPTTTYSTSSTTSTSTTSSSTSTTPTTTSSTTTSSTSSDPLRIHLFQCEVRGPPGRGLTVNFEAVVHGGRKPYVFTLFFGDGSSASSTQHGSAFTAFHEYEGRGPYVAALSVLDQQGESETTSLIVPNQCRNTHTTTTSTSSTTTHTATTTTSSTTSSSTREPRCDTHPARCNLGDGDVQW
ncbi:MAG: hypothetical protein QXX19_08185 [Candidatus Caldarchaeum sp.]